MCCSPYCQFRLQGQQTTGWQLAVDLAHLPEGLTHIVGLCAPVEMYRDLATREWISRKRTWEEDEDSLMGIHVAHLPKSLHGISTTHYSLRPPSLFSFPPPPSLPRLTGNCLPGTLTSGTSNGKRALFAKKSSVRSVALMTSSLSGPGDARAATASVKFGWVEAAGSACGCRNTERWTTTRERRPRRISEEGGKYKHERLDNCSNQATPTVAIMRGCTPGGKTTPKSLVRSAWVTAARGQEQ